MEASSPPRPAVDLATRLYHQLVYTLTDLLPPPLNDFHVEGGGPWHQQAAVSGAAPAAGWDQRIAENVSENGANSQEMAFETWMSAQPWNQGSRGSGETDPRAGVREAMAESRFTSWRPQVNRSSACPCLLGG